MTIIHFTQFMRPDGRRVETGIDRPQEIATRAQKIIAAGYRFEAEVLTTGEVSLTITNDEEDHAFEVIPNGEAVPDAVDRLISNFNI